MSRGIGAHANLILEDEQTVIYEYGGYNLNDLEYKNENHLYDGMITISRECFVEPVIHEKRRRCHQVGGKLFQSVYLYQLIMGKCWRKA